MVPAPGPAADLARELGEVRIGAPGALLYPTGPVSAMRALAGVREHSRAVGAAVLASGADLVIASSATVPGATAGGRRAKAGVLLYSGEMLGRGGARSVAGAAMAGLAARSADAVLVPSRAVAAWYERRGIRTHVLHPPIESSPPAAALAARGAELRARLGISVQEQVVCSLGAITEGRGQDTLVRALALASRRGREWRLVIGGEAYERPRDLEFSKRIRLLVRDLGLSERVIFAGAVDDAPALYAAAQVFVNPTRVAESFGRAACEALAAACPVVATRVGGVAEALIHGETALLVDPDSPQALADAIGTLTEDAALASSMALAGGRDVARRFAPRVSQPVFEQAVRTALEGGARRSEELGHSRRLPDE